MARGRKAATPEAAPAAPEPQGFRTVQARATAESMVKPGELVDLVELTPLTLADRRIYNQLLENAWEAIDRPVTHVIAKAELRGSHNSNDRIGESIERLMAAIVKVQVVSGGEAAVERVQLLGGNVEVRSPDGLLHYEIPARLRRIIRDSTVFARLRKEVMFALTSKYALTLYEMVQKRGNLRHRSSERFSLETLRAVLGVPKGRLATWANLKLRALDPAVREVSALSDHVVELEPVKSGRRVVAVELRWWRKDAEGVGAAARELAGSRVGRRARIDGTAEQVVVPNPNPSLPPRPPGFGVPARPAWLDRAGTALRTETYETARLRFPGWDIYAVEAEWRGWAQGREPARDPDRAFLAFFRIYAEAHPL